MTFRRHGNTLVKDDPERVVSDLVDKADDFVLQAWVAAHSTHRVDRRGQKVRTCKICDSDVVRMSDHGGDCHFVVIREALKDYAAALGVREEYL